MKKSPNIYEVKAKMWVYPGMAGWRFITVPKKISNDITEKFGAMKRGWGSLRVGLKLGNTSWKSSIFPDKKSGCYLLPIKAAVRKKENIKDDDTLAITLEIQISY